MDKNVKDNSGIKKEAPVGILRLEMGKPRRASTEFKFLTQGEPASPQPSVDRLSVTFAEDSLKSDSSPPKSNNSFSPGGAARGKMDKVHFPQATAQNMTTMEADNSDEEDYSVSVNAIIQRKASTRLSKRRSSRRASSPFSPDILPGSENGRRRSSAFTTSSGDTAITMDENFTGGVTQDEIFENIKLHKEVLSNVKMQPWNMRKKLKLVVQAKNYIKQHEGALQERLAQSHSTRDMLARWNILLIKKWQRYRREIANLSNWFIPWELKIKEIESHFGSVVASYFTFLRWLFWVNIVLGIVLTSFVTIPEQKYQLQFKFVVVLCVCDSMHKMWFIAWFWFSVSSFIQIISGTLFSLEHYMNFLQNKSPEQEVTFYLCHRSDFSRGDQLFIDDIESIAKSRFDPKLETKIIIHGWTHSSEVPWVKEMRETMANTGRWNVIVVDWSDLSHAIYVEARVHTNTVGKQVAFLCMSLSKHTGIPISRFHLIGHSMGGQVAAYAGHRIQTECGQSLGRITGLDPAAPLYEWPHIESLDEVLDKSDALFVDVIHTNSKRFGIAFSWGHVDYYPNGGESQPGCKFWICSHLRACDFWTASVKNPELFKAYPSKSWDEFLQEGRKRADQMEPVPMGIAAGPSIPSGTYFLETNGEELSLVNSVTTMMDSFLI